MVVNGGLPISQQRVPSERQVFVHTYRAISTPKELPPRLKDEPMAGFVFVCNDETMTENFDRRLFGLPKIYFESVKSIRRGMPLFLYNYSTRLMHGVFEAASDGALNIEPGAWDSVVHGSKFPSQVRFLVREFRAPLEEEKFRPVLFHFEHKKFRLELTQTEVSELLKLFANQDDWLTEWQFREKTEMNKRSQGGQREKVPVSKAPPLLKGPPLPRKRVNGGTGYTAKWRPHCGDVEAAVENLNLQEPEEACTTSNGDLKSDDVACSSGSRCSYVAALKSGMQAESPLTETNVNESGKVDQRDAILGRLHDPDPAVNSAELVDGMKRQPAVSAKTRMQQGRTPYEFRKPKDGRQASSAPLIQLHPPFTHVPMLTPIRFPVYSDGFGYRPVQRSSGDMGGFVWAPQQPVVLAGHPGPFSVPSPGLVANVESNFEALHAEVLEFARTARPLPCVRARAEAAVECVRRGVKSLWPGADVEVFGSFATGLCLPHSDVDVVVLDAPVIGEVSGTRGFIPLIRQLATEFKRLGWCESLLTIESAAMPVIKLRCNPSGEKDSLVAIDVTLGGRSGLKGGRKRIPGVSVVHNGVAAREYVIEKLKQLPALAPLVLLMKSYLHHKNLNDVYFGGLGSFSLTLMLVFYLEQVPLSWSSLTVNGTTTTVAPSSEASSLSELSDSDDDNNLTDSTSTSTSDDGSRLTSPGAAQEPIITRAWQVVDELLASLQGPGAPSLGSLLIGFLHIFGQEFDFLRTRIVLKGVNGSAGGIFALEPTLQPACLWIDDPLRPGTNVGAGSFAMCDVQAAFRDMLFVLAKPELGRNQHGCSLPHLDQLFRSVS